MGAETGLPAPGTPARPINCTSEDESQTEDEVERECAARRGARSKRKAKPSPRIDGNDDVADRRGDFDRDNGARGSGDTMPGTRPYEPVTDAGHRHRGGQTVWIASQTGKRFHRLGCGKMYAVNQAEELDRITALAKGYSQCRVCKP